MHPIKKYVEWSSHARPRTRLIMLAACIITGYAIGVLLHHLP